MAEWATRGLADDVELDDGDLGIRGLVKHDALVAGQAQGEIDAALDAKAVSSLLLATIVGITVLAKVDRPSARTKRIATAIAALLRA